MLQENRFNFVGRAKIHTINTTLAGLLAKRKDRLWKA